MDSKAQLFYEMDCYLLNCDKPSIYLNSIFKTSIFQEYPFNMLHKLFGIKQSPRYHPEGDVWTHTMMVIDEAARFKIKSKDIRVFMWAALLHDIGKPYTTKIKNGKIISYDHDKLGARLAKSFFNYFLSEQMPDYEPVNEIKSEKWLDQDFIKKVASLVRWHMQILFVVKNSNISQLNAMKKQTDIDELALLGFCDRLGRLNVNKKQEEDNIKAFLQKCKEYPD